MMAMFLKVPLFLLSIKMHAIEEAPDGWMGEDGMSHHHSSTRQMHSAGGCTYTECVLCMGRFVKNERR